MRMSFELAANVCPKHSKSCFMNMIDYYLLRAVVSFCTQTKTAASFSEVYLLCIFGSSWSSDTAIQVTCIVR